MTAPLPHGWFEIPGVQTGERQLAERVGPLKPVLKHASGASVLDLGCAEGLIGKWLADAGGARKVHGLDKHLNWVEMARQLMPSPKYDARFEVCDFDHWREEVPKLGLLKAYDITLCLNVAQKLFKPEEFVRALARMTNNVFVYSGPDRILMDARSGGVPVDIEAVLQPKFQLTMFDKGNVHEDKGHLGVRMIFVRPEVAERMRADRKRFLAKKKARK